MSLHWDNHCWEFCEFSDNILNDRIVIDILESICDERDHPASGVFFRASQSLDREGANREIVGYIINGDAEYSFRCVNGNWNGTEIREFEKTELGTGCIHRLSCWYD